VTQTGRWKRFVLEGGTIVASILVAFALDAAWERTQERGIALDQLEGVAEELLAARRGVLSQAEEQRGITDAATHLLALLDSASEGALVTTPDTLWAATMTIPSVEIPTTAVVGLAGSGGIRFVPNAGLRDSLIVWPGRVEDRLGNQEESWRFVVEEFTPTLRRSGDVRGAFDLVGGWSGLPADRAAIPIRVRNGEELRNVLGERRMNAVLVLEDYVTLAAHMEWLARAVQSEVSRVP